MQRNDERFGDDLIDLGDAAQLTKGQGIPEFDVLGGLQSPAGLSND